jgi:LmbE family N-acetylglucosaminyl deacetylase
VKEEGAVKSVLVLAGHLDDSIIAVGGILRKFVERGVRVAVVCFGNGDEAFTAGRDRAEVARQFLANAVAAHKVLGIDDFVCHDWPDYGVQENRESYRLCMAAIRRTRPDVILGHDWLEYFQHRAMARLACDSWWQAGWDSSADLGQPWKARALYHFEVLQSMSAPTHIVDVSEAFPRKLEAWAKFVVAQAHLDQLPEQMEARARFRGSQIGVKYAEALTRSAFVPAPVRNVTEEL